MTQWFTWLHVLSYGVIFEECSLEGKSLRVTDMMIDIIVDSHMERLELLMMDME